MSPLIPGTEWLAKYQAVAPLGAASLAYAPFTGAVAMAAGEIPWITRMAATNAAEAITESPSMSQLRTPLLGSNASYVPEVDLGYIPAIIRF